jgi:hypothetical protein
MIVMTWILCSIPKADKALQQMRRVLKPSGQLLFIEHGVLPILALWLCRTGSHRSGNGFQADVI